MPRVDLFTAIHKGVRALIYEVGKDLQPLDAGDATGARTLDRLDHALGMLEEHHEHEERSIFPHIRTSEPAMIAELEAQHEEVRRLLAATSEALAATRAAAADSGAAEQAAHLNRRFNDLAAYFLTHLAHEEATVLPASQAHFSDPELAGMQQEIMGNIPPERNADWMRLMLGALSRAELTGMFAGMKASAPPEALEGMKKMAAGIVEEGRWTAIARDAGL